MKSTLIVTQHALCLKDCWSATFFGAHIHKNIISDKHRFFFSFWFIVVRFLFCIVVFRLLSTISSEKNEYCTWWHAIHNEKKKSKCRMVVYNLKLWYHFHGAFVLQPSQLSWFTCPERAIAKWSLCLNWVLDFGLPAKPGTAGRTFPQCCCKYCVHASQS